jgi:transcriptional regulator with XRE-family HTH domain
MDASERFGESALRIRQGRKLSQEDLADLSGVHRSQISVIENGRRTPWLPTIVRLAGARPAAATAPET